MSKTFWYCLLLSPAVLGATLVASSAAVATESQTTNTVILSQAGTTENISKNNNIERQDCLLYTSDAADE